MSPKSTSLSSSTSASSSLSLFLFVPNHRFLILNLFKRNFLIMLPVLLSVITRALVTSDNCFGGVETFEKIAGMNFEPNTVPMAGVLLQQDNVALTRDCINLCRQQQRCTTFFLDYIQFRCSAYVESSRRHRDHLQTSKSANLFEKICLKGISRQEFDHVCGNERLWAFERVKDTFLDGFVEKELTNMVDREECAKACLIESAFICRSAEFDEVKRICRLSKENRRTQPQAFVYVKNSQKDYIENQCAPAGPASCVYTTKTNTNVFSMDSLQFATSSEDCQLQCDRETSFNCRAYGFINNRCMLSGDDEKTIGKHPLIMMKGAMYGERTCVAELCTNGIFTYEKITGHVLRSAITSPVELPEYTSLGVTAWCRESCDMAQLNCPAFTVNYKNSRCERLDRNTQGRTSDLTLADGESYFEKICLRVPQIMSQCQDKFWAFERVLGYELAPILYVKTLNFVQSRRDCQEYCLQEREFPCRSALYNDETTECKLSPEDRRTSPGHYYRSRSMKINYLENQCVRIHSSCPYQRTENAYPTYTDVVETNSIYSNEACEKLCNDNRYFLCRSYAYYSSNSQCFLSGDDSVSAGLSSHIQHRSNIMYYERQCSKLNTFNANQSMDGQSVPHGGNGQPGLTDSMTTDEYLIPLTPTNDFFKDRIGESSTLPSSSIPGSSGFGSGASGGPATTPDIDLSNVNKEVVIINGTVGGIITTKITRFPESLLPTLSPPVISSLKPIYPPDISSHNGVPTGTGSGNRPNDPLSPDKINSNDDNRFNMNYPSNKKCAPNARFLFEKVTSFEPIGGHLTLLYTDLQNPGIVTECAKRCEHSTLCRAFVVDYYHQTCHGLFENSSVGLLDLRLSMGKDYFEGFCVPNYVHCDKFWPFDRIIDQAVIGSRPEEIVRFVSRAECRNRCLEEKKFRCSSVSYNSFTHECHLYSEERDSGSLNLQFTKGIDFMENQCVIDVKSCRYHAIERDISIVSVTKSVRGTSTFHCEQACDYEKEFNCRSYTYLDNPDGSIAPGGNLCLLSADNRATSHQGSIQFRPRALYAEKDCFFRRNPTIPINSNINLNNNDNNGNRLAYLPPSSMSISGNLHHNIDHDHSHNHPPPTVVGGPNFINSEQEEGLTARRMDQSTNTHLNSNKPIITQPILDRINNPESKNNPATFNNMVQLQHIPHRCQPDEYSFEKTFGYDLRYAQRERAPISARIGLANFCKDECLRRGDRCAAFTIEYGSNSNAQQQNCYFLSEAAMENRNQLNKLMATSYNEKICLREKTCDSTWAFERMIGYTMDSSVVAPDREINSIMFRTACQDLCLLEKNFSCHSLTYDYGRRICRLYKNTRRSMPQAFQKTNDHVDYFENKCIKELSTCQYRDYKDRYFNYVDKVSIATSLIDCQRQCDSEISFHCKSVNYDLVTKECTLSSEDSTSIQNVHNDNDIDNNNNGNGNGLNKKTIPMDQSIIAAHKRGSIFSEKGNCEQVSVQCNQQDMMLTLNFDSPFHGRVYTKNNPSQCFVTGNGQLKLQFAIPLDSRCGTYQESTSSYVNEVIVQQHSVIMTDNDRTIRVLCSFEISDQTITLANGEQQQQQQKNVPLPGIDVSSNYGRSFTDRKSTATVVTNTAAPPSIIMRILDHTGQDAQVVSLGDDLTLRIELRGERNSPFAIFARNLYARSSNGESLFLIDNNGCPIDSTIFPALQLDPNDQRSLYSKFKAFRFPSTGVVNFEVQIRFCQDYCEPIKCTQLNGHVDSYGRRRRRRRRSITINNFQELFIGNGSGNDGFDSLINENHNSSDPHQQPQQNYSLDGIDIWSFENSTTSTTASTIFNINNNGTNSFQNNSSNQNLSFTNNNNNTNGRKSVRNINMNNNDKSFERTRSNKTGFIYPTNNYRYHRNNESYDGNSTHNNNNSHTLFTSNNNKNDNIGYTDYNENNVSNFIESNSTNNKFKRHPSNWKELNDVRNIGDKNMKKNMIQNGNTLTMGSTMVNGHHNHNPANAALPLPTSATEVPLSLAIMVDNDDTDDSDDPDDNKTDNTSNISNEFDDQTSSSLDLNDALNLQMIKNNEDHQHLHHYHHQPDHQKQFANNNLGVARRLETRHNLRNVLNDKTKGKNLHLMCSENCTNTGIIIFITTLIVTIVHLTLGASVYLYLTKLKQSKKQQRQLFYNNQQQHNYHHSGMSFSPLNYQIPPIGTVESLSPISTLDDVDGIGGEDTLTRNAILSVEDDVEDNDADGYNIDDKNKAVQQKPLSWFGENGETQQQEQKQNFGSIRSTFNRENIFFGAKEQRFFGLNSYSFPNSINVNNHDRNGQSK